MEGRDCLKAQAVQRFALPACLAEVLQVPWRRAGASFGSTANAPFDRCARWFFSTQFLLVPPRNQRALLSAEADNNALPE